MISLVPLTDVCMESLNLERSNHIVVIVVAGGVQAKRYNYKVSIIVGHGFPDVILL